MPRDWPDPRFPDKPVSWWEIALAGSFVASGYAAMVWGAVEIVRMTIGQ